MGNEDENPLESQATPKGVHAPPDFEGTLHGIPGLVWSAEPDGSVDFLNRRWLSYTGMALGDATGSGWQTATHPDDLPALVSTWQRLLAAGQPGEVECRLRGRNGDYRWFLFRAEPSRGADGRTAKWHGQTIDIEDRKCAEALLAAENQLLEMVARGTALGPVLTAICQHIEAIVAGSFATVLLVAEDGVALTYGAAPSLPATLMDAVTDCRVAPDGGPCARATYFRQATCTTDLGSENVPARLKRVLRAAGLNTCLCVPILSSDDRVLGSFALYWRATRLPGSRDREVLAQFTHIASIAIERQQADESMRRMQDDLARVARVATVGELAASIAHELNQPLTGVVLNANACLRWLTADPVDPVDLAEARESAARILRDGKRAGAVIERLRALFGKAESERRPVDLEDAIREVLTLARAKLQQHQVALRTEWGAGVPLALADKVQLQQVIMNLIVNAIEAVRAIAGRQREITIATAGSPDGQVSVSVRDNGAGVDPRRRDEIFGAFYTSRAGGMGMGLTISRTIVEHHGGRLWLEDDGTAGATFRFTVPSAW